MESSIYGQDFSSRLIELAPKKMPDSHLYQGDGCPDSDSLEECSFINNLQPTPDPVLMEAGFLWSGSIFLQFKYHGGNCYLPKIT